MLGRYRYRVLLGIGFASIHFLNDWYLKRVGKWGGERKNPSWYIAFFKRVITPVSFFLFSFWTQNHSYFVFVHWNTSALKLGTQVSFEFGLQQLKHIGIQDNERRMANTRYRIDTFRYRTRYWIYTMILVSI